MAFVVLQHLSPDFKSLMDELLARRTTMPVRQAEHDTPLEPDSVYLLPPMKEMIIRDRRLLLSDKDPRHGLTLPIDIFFRSLAKDVGDHAIAVVLSGSGSDGSRGILEVSKAGGVVFCESVETAKFNGMPGSAIRTGVVDRVLPPEEIADAVAALGRGGALAQIAGGGRRRPRHRRRRDSRPAAHRIRHRLLALQDRHGHAPHRAAARAQPIARSRGLPRSAAQRSARAELALRGSADRRHAVLPRRRGVRGAGAAHHSGDRRARPSPTIPTIRFASGSPGCATGQEAYSIAMLFHEQLTARQRPLNVKILATDVHKASLEVASAGTLQRGAGRRHQPGAARALLHAAARTATRSRRPCARASSSRRTT